MIRTILLLPKPEHRERLLAPGAPVWIDAEPSTYEPAEFGYTVDPLTPVCDDTDCPDGSDPRPRIKVAWPSIGVCGSVVSALHLVLARDGAEVHEGIDRIGRVAWLASVGAVQRIRAAALELEVRIALGREPGLDPDVALNRLRQIVAPLGTLLLLAADGREVPHA